MAAIACFQNALDIYEAKYVFNEFEKNYYGMALSLFSLGYIYRFYDQYLSRDNSFSQRCEEDQKHFLVESISKSHEKAQNYFRSAYK